MSKKFEQLKSVSLKDLSNNRWDSMFGNYSFAYSDHSHAWFNRAHKFWPTPEKPPETSPEMTFLLTNNPPDAKNDSFSGSYLTLVTGNVLADNGSGADSDPDLDTLSVVESSVISTNGRTVTLSSDGKFYYM